MPGGDGRRSRLPGGARSSTVRYWAEAVRANSNMMDASTALDLHTPMTTIHDLPTGEACTTLAVA